MRFSLSERAMLPLLAVLACGTVPAQKDFVPDTLFKGSSLAGWHTLGAATWSAESGALKASANTTGGWLLSDQKFQDVRFYARMNCKDACEAGIVFRAEKTSDGGFHGIYVSLNDKDLDAYNVTVDAGGRIIQREKLPPAPTENVGIAGPAGGGPSRPATPATTSAAPPRPRRKTASLGRPGEWSTIELIIENDTLNGSVNDGGLAGGEVTPEGFGAIALYAGNGEVSFDHVGFKDINGEALPKELLSTHFTERRISDMYYGWSAVSADTRKNGTLDVISGPFIYAGPDYIERKRYRPGRQYNPSIEYAPDMINFAADFNGDGWPDIIASDIQGNNRPLDLYINPHGESRKWTKSRAVNTVSTELVLFKDIDGDGKPEILFGGNGTYAYAKPDLNDVTAPWKITPISEKMDRLNNHGMGVGDINGDGRADFITPAGWYEQPAPNAVPAPWKFHAANFGDGGAEMGIYDVNGDGKNDVVTSIAAHGFGLAWFEQQRAVDGTITFVRHEIAGDYSTPTNAGGAVFSQIHAAAFADMDGDGIPDMVVGKSMWHHLETWGDPDPYGPPVLYVYRTVRDPKAPGGARFVPELVNNHSGVGSAIQVVDLNHDGAQDILTQSVLGTFIFYGHPGNWPAAGKATTATTK